MPRLFDLLPDNTRKELIAEARKGKPKAARADSGQAPKRPEAESVRPKVIAPAYIPDFVALDVETTGLDYKNDRVIEVGAVRFAGGKPQNEFSSFINAGKPIPPYITELTSICDADLENAPSFPEIAAQLLEFIGGLPLCGHQVEFDATFISEELKRAGLPVLQVQLLDTALLSRVVLQPLQYFSLKFVSQSLEVTLNNAHRALHDARASGEVASLLLPRLAEFPLSIRQTMAAYAPVSYFKSLLVRSLGGARPMVRVGQAFGGQSIPKLGIPENFSEIDREDISAHFSDGGSLSKSLKGFIPRPSQIDMALHVADVFNDRSFLIAEAGTGTGKSLAYLIPAAQWALQNNTRVIVSTRTRNLQDQLMSNDLPLVSQVVGEKLRFSVLKGRSNYLCRNRWIRLLSGELGNLSPRERNAVLPLIPWSETTTIGDIEEQNQFNPKWFGKIWNLISAESHDCKGRRCSHFQTCFLQQARQKALGAHIVVINHALFFSDVCSETLFLGRTGAIIFDEAHHLESSGHRHLRTELDTNRLNLFMDVVNNLVLTVGALKEEAEIYSNGKELRAILKQFRKRSQDLLQELDRWATRQQPQLLREYQIAFCDDPFETLAEPIAFQMTIAALGDTLYHLKQAVAGMNDTERFQELHDEVQACSERTSQLKADFQYLISGKTEDHVFWIEGNHEKGWTKLCGVPLDVSGMLSQIWEQCCGPVIFTSATLSISRSTDYFKRAVGLAPHDSRTTAALFESPFGAWQAIRGAIKNSPDPDNSEYPAYVASVVAGLHRSLNKNILVLFTANTMLNSVSDILKKDVTIEKGKVLAQGLSGTRHALLEQFKKSSGMILLGTDSFWEGIDVPGEACEIVVIPRLPFPVPTHPLTQAIARKMEATHGESFFSYSIPEAVIKYRQGAGRLIRTMSDRGALVVLDSRIVTKGYGKQFTRSLPGDFCSFETFDEMLEKVSGFFSSPSGDPGSCLKYVPLEEA